MTIASTNVVEWNMTDKKSVFRKIFSKFLVLIFFAKFYVQFPKVVSCATHCAICSSCKFTRPSGNHPSHRLYHCIVLLHFSTLNMYIYILLKRYLKCAFYGKDTKNFLKKEFCWFFLDFEVIKSITTL